MFDPFVTHGKEDGSGLGLAICRQIMAGHEGSIEIDPEFESGTRFLIRLPASLKTGERISGRPTLSGKG